VVAFDHRAYSHLDCRRCDGLSKVWMASVDPTDLNPLGAEIIHVAGFVGGSMPLLEKRMRVKSDANSNVVCWALFGHGALSDLSSSCAPKRTSADDAKFTASRATASGARAIRVARRRTSA
jgi:hypothetical protein